MTDTTTPTPNQLPTVLGVGSLPAAAVEAAARALFAVENCDRRQMLDVESNWRGRLNDANREEYRILANAALTAAYPFIAAQALRDAADDPALRLSGHSGISITRLRARAATIEGKSE